MYLNIQNMSVGIIGQYGGGYHYSMDEMISGKPKNWFSDVNFGKSAGAELRVSGFSFYSYPTSFSYEFHYPIIEQMKDLPPKHYFSILFDFQE